MIRIHLYDSARTRAKSRERPIGFLVPRRRPLLADCGVTFYSHNLYSLYIFNVYPHAHTCYVCECVWCVAGRGLKTNGFNIHAPPRATTHVYHTMRTMSRSTLTHKNDSFVYYTYAYGSGAEGCNSDAIFYRNAIIACARCHTYRTRICVGAMRVYSAYSIKYTRVRSCAKYHSRRSRFYRTVF